VICITRRNGSKRGFSHIGTGEMAQQEDVPCGFRANLPCYRIRTAADLTPTLFQFIGSANVSRFPFTL